MLLTVEELIKLLRDSVNIQYADAEVIDPLYLAMTDEDLMLYIKLGITHAYPEITDIRDLEDGCEYPIILLAKIDLYTKLAVLKAEKVDLGADNNNYIKNSQRFDHYMKLAEDARDEYQKYLDEEESGGLDNGGGIQTYEMLRAKNHYSNRNYTYQKTPKVSIKIDNITTDSVSIRWIIRNFSFFGRAKVYISDSQIVDIHKDGAFYKDKIDENAKLIKSTSNIRDNAHIVSGLEPNTQYYIAIFSIERNQVFGYSETSFTTLPLLEDEEDVLIEDINE